VNTDCGSPEETFPGDLKRKEKGGSKCPFMEFFDSNRLFEGTDEEQIKP